MKMNKTLLSLMLFFFHFLVNGQNVISLKAPETTPQYGVAEYVFTVNNPLIENPFTDIEIIGSFTSGNTIINVSGFADSQDGSVFKLRFSPELKNTTYMYELTFNSKNINRKFTGKLISLEPVDKGPVVVDPQYPKHFMHAATKEPFIHLGCTEYHLLDTSNNDSQIASTIDYCLQNGFNKIRFLLTGYPRDNGIKTSNKVEHGISGDFWKAPNYGAFPGSINPLPAWLGKPHNYDFTQFNVEFWQRVDNAVLLMKEKDIVATCIIMIEKQKLPSEIGRLTDNEYRLYNYAVARLAAFNNVWWDLGNEHNEFRDVDWGNKMGDFVKKNDPYNRLSSAHAYADFFYSNSPWADFIITQHGGDSVHHWVLNYYDVPKPYVNEEYGYEGNLDKRGHGMNSNWIRKCHWEIAMAGGYGTYGDWSNGVSYFYMGIPGPGIAAKQLKHLKSFLESVPFKQMVPSDSLTTNGYCLSIPGKMWIIYLPEGGPTDIDLSFAEKNTLTGNWYNPVSGEWGERISLKRGKNSIAAPTGKDRVFLIK